MNEKLEKMKKFGWRDIVLIVSYIASTFLIPFVIAFIFILVEIVGSGIDINDPDSMTNIMNAVLAPATVWSSLISGLVNVVIVLALYWTYIKDAWKRFWQAWKTNIPLILGGYVLVIIVNYAFSYFINSDTSANQETIETIFANASTLETLAMLIPVTFCAPLVEEFLCRKALFGSFKHNKIIGAIMFVVSSVLFGLLHYGFDNNLIVLVPYMLMGAIMAGTYWLSDNIFTAIGLHFFNNALAAMFILLF